MKEVSPKSLWVLVDKRGTILERGKLRKASLEHGAEVPQFSFWKDRDSARWQVSYIRRNMTSEAWKTWKFRVIRYRRAK